MRVAGLASCDPIRDRNLIQNFLAFSTTATIALAFAFPVTFAMGCKKPMPIKKKREKKEPNFPSKWHTLVSKTLARREAEILSDEVTMEPGGMTMTNPEGEVVKINCAGDLRANPWVVSCSPLGYLKQEAAMQASG